MKIGRILSKSKIIKKRIGEINWGSKIIESNKQYRKALADRASQKERQDKLKEELRKIYCE